MIVIVYHCTEYYSTWRCWPGPDQAAWYVLCTMEKCVRVFYPVFECFI